MLLAIAARRGKRAGCKTMRCRHSFQAVFLENEEIDVGQEVRKSIRLGDAQVVAHEPVEQDKTGTTSEEGEKTGWLERETRI